ncbi:MAG TPA: DUF996 domain-containing protein [Candidatus Limnocylindrales bacterium]|nr:DUF996 domain-containing protein [Candidatus Limnocylindrales bacterium]
MKKLLFVEGAKKIEEKTMTLESSKTLGGVGSILLLVGSLLTSYTYGVVTLVGAIILLIGLSGLASYYKERGIFSNAIYSVVAGIVGAVVAVVAVLYIIFYTTILTSLLQEIYPTWNGSWSSLPSIRGMTPNTANITTSAVTSVLGALFLVLVILWVFLVVSAFFARRSLKTLSTKTGVGLFSTAALVLLVGAFLTIVFIGFLLIWIAVLLMAIAFFQIPSQQEQPQAPMAPPSPSTPTPV